MPSCVVILCENNSQNNKNGTGRITYHRFPRNPALCDHWTAIIRRSRGESQWKPQVDTDFICSAHFNDKDFYKTKGGMKKLCYEAVPQNKLFLPTAASYNNNKATLSTVTNTSSQAVNTDKTVTEPKVVVERLHFLQEGNSFAKAKPPCYVSTTTTRQGPTMIIQPITVSQENNPYLGICRACLATDCKMFPMTEDRLKWYENLTGFDVKQMHPELPKWLCSECLERLMNVNKFRVKSLKAHKMLLHVLYKYDEINIDTIKTVNREKNNLASSLCRNETELMDIYPNETETKTILVLNSDILDNIDFTDNNILNDEVINDDHYEMADDDVNQYMEDDNCVLMKDDDGTVMKYQSDPIIDDDNDQILEVNNKEHGTDDDYIFDPDEMVYGRVYNNSVKYLEVPIHSDEKREFNEILSHVKKIENRMSKKKNITADEEVDGFTITSLSFEEQVEESQKIIENKAKHLFACKLCTVRLRGPVALERHMRSHTNKSGNFKCAVCKLHFRDKQKATKHAVDRHLYKYSCNHCNFVTSVRRGAVFHNNYHKGGQHKCPHCPEIFTLHQHIRNEHPSPNFSEYFCQFCGQRFFCKRSTLGHIRYKHHMFNSKQVPEDGPFCEICDVRFLNEEAYNNHMKCSFKHETDEGEIPEPSPKTEYRLDHYKKCHKCDAQFRNDQSYRKHLKAKHPEDFSAVNHTRYKTQTPQTTRRTATTDGGVNKRKSKRKCLKHHHKTCVKCDEIFSTKRTYKQHMKRFHPEDYVEEPKPRRSWPKYNKSRLCPQCGKSFTSLQAYQAHELRHKGHYFVCDICDQRITTFVNLVRHRKLHRGLRPFKCELCEKTFTTKTILQSHIQHVHLNVPWPARRRQRGEEKPRKRPVAVVPELPERPQYEELLRTVET